MGVSLHGPAAGLVLAVVGVYLLLGPIEVLARKPSPIRRRMTPEDVPPWMKVFFRSLGVVLLALAALLLR